MRERRVHIYLLYCVWLCQVNVDLYLLYCKCVIKIQVSK